MAMDMAEHMATRMAMDMATCMATCMATRVASVGRERAWKHHRRWASKRCCSWDESKTKPSAGVEALRQASKHCDGWGKHSRGLLLLVRFLFLGFALLLLLLQDLLEVFLKHAGQVLFEQRRVVRHCELARLRSRTLPTQALWLSVRQSATY